MGQETNSKTEAMNEEPKDDRCKYCGSRPTEDWQSHFEEVHNLAILNARVDELRLVIQESIQLLDGEGTRRARQKLTTGLGLEVPTRKSAFPEVVQITAPLYIRFTNGTVIYRGESERNGVAVEIRMPREVETPHDMELSVTLVARGVVVSLDNPA